MKKISALPAIVSIMILRPAAANAQCSVGPLAVTDFHVTSYTFSNQAIANWADFTVQVNFTTAHTWAGDLKAWITVAGCSSGNGTYTLFNFQTGGTVGSGCNMAGTYSFIPSGSSYLSSAGGGASNPIPACVSGCVPAGAYTSAQPWPLSGSCTGGTITVSISDDQGLDTGAALVHLGGTSNCYALPVQINYFKAAATSIGNQLEWGTASEQNSAYFIAEQSTDNISWTALGQVPAAGNSGGPRDYSFVHPNPVPEQNYYRIKLVSLDNSVQYSRIIYLKKQTSTSGKPDVYPNPVKQYAPLRFRLTTARADQYIVTVISTNGAVMLQRNLLLQKGENTVLLPVDELKPGLYILSLQSTGKETQQVKFAVF